MIVWGKVIDCIIDADVNYLNGELFNRQLRIKGKFLTFGNLHIFEHTLPTELPSEETEGEKKEEKEEKTEKKIVLTLKEKSIQICVPVDATFMTYYQGMVAIMSFYFKDRDLYANVSLTDPETIKSFINMSSFYKKYGISIPNVLDKIMYRKVPT